MRTPIIERWSAIQVVRDDLLEGGTKRRVAGILMTSDEVVYAGPCCGYAQLAVALSARDHGRRCTLFVAKRATRHRLTELSAAASAKIVEVSPGYLSVVRSRARDYCEQSGAVLLPFGLACQQISDALRAVAASIAVQPKEVWTVAGSGTLTRALQDAWPAADFFAVAVGKDADCGRAKVFVAPETFEQAAKRPPPFPSSLNYDAKAWQFIQKHASPDALFWNIGA